MKLPQWRRQGHSKRQDCYRVKMTGVALESCLQAFEALATSLVEVFG